MPAKKKQFTHNISRKRRRNLEAMPRARQAKRAAAAAAVGGDAATMLVPPRGDAATMLVPPRGDAATMLVPPRGDAATMLVPPPSSQDLSLFTATQLLDISCSEASKTKYRSPAKMPTSTTAATTTTTSTAATTTTTTSTAATTTTTTSTATTTTTTTSTAATTTTTTSTATTTTTTTSMAPSTATVTTTTSTAIPYVATKRSSGQPRKDVPVATRRNCGRPKGSKSKRRPNYFVLSPYEASTSTTTQDVATSTTTTQDVATSTSMATSSRMTTSVASTFTATPDVANISDINTNVVSDIPVSTPASAEVSSATQTVPLFSNVKMVNCNTLYNTVLSKVFCSECCVKKMETKYYEHHLETVIVLECPGCGHQLGEKPSSYKVSNEVTGRMVYGEMVAGEGYTALARRNALCTLPCITLDTYNKYASVITEKCIESCQKILAESRDIIVEEYAKLNIVPDVNGILDIDVTYNCIWHTKRHHSNIGVGIALDAVTKLVVDYEVLCNYCQMCAYMESSYSKQTTSLEKYEQYENEHEHNCCINYSGTSAKMESEAAAKIWQRSLEKKLRYKTIVSDGDSSTYKTIVDLNDGEGPYPGVNVEKEECINHYAKRLKNRLTNLVKSQYVEKELKTGRKRKEFAMKKKGMLTDSVIDKLAQYFQKNLREKIGHGVEDMRNCIMASFFHCSSTDEKPQHHLCPTGDKSWCFYQKAAAADLPPPSHTKMKVQFQLEPAYMEEVHNIYKDLTSDEMMQRCVKGRTQNPNESLHQRIWSYCNKAKYQTKRHADFAVSHAVADYNTGYVRSCLDIALGYGRSAVTQAQLELMEKHMKEKRKRSGKKRKRELRPTSLEDIR
ncbi:uncharacterized protein [Cherax quadricarinatus]